MKKFLKRIYTIGIICICLFMGISSVKATQEQYEEKKYRYIGN